VKALAPRARGASMPRDNAERVVSGARHLSPFLGERMLAKRLTERSVFLRELLPQDLKLEFEQLTQIEANQAARFLAGVVGTAHARQMDASMRKSWGKELGRRRSKSLDAPSWLWCSVATLIATHETEYLEHCRRYAAVRNSLTDNLPGLRVWNATALDRLMLMAPPQVTRLGDGTLRPSDFTAPRGLSVSPPCTDVGVSLASSPKSDAEHFISCPTYGGWSVGGTSGRRVALATSRRGEPIGWEQRGFRTLKRLFVINNSEGKRI
jgi:Uncharacterized protein conserved in bacteria (DUF2252)